MKTIHTLPLSLSLSLTVGNFGRKRSQFCLLFPHRRHNMKFQWRQSTQWYCCGALPVASSVTTFNEYVSSDFLPHIMKHLETSKRVDIVRDTYTTSCIKESKREKRSKGIRWKVEGQSKLPGNWPDFLCDPKNKQELDLQHYYFHCLAKWKTSFHYIR